MEVRIFHLIVVWCSFSSLFLPAVNSIPISVDFNKCRTSIFPQNPLFPDVLIDLACCPIPPTKPIINGPPPPSTPTPRVRMAAQCTDAEYAAKLDKAYKLMRALPSDDPRSFGRQWELHCSYCGQAFYQSNSTGIVQGIDIHYSWLFGPWHRWYLFFHERILQSLLGDPTFSLNYWNWDNPFTVGNGTSSDGSCLLKGHDFPAIYNNTLSATYDSNRSANAKGQGLLKFPDFGFNPGLPAALQANYNASEEVQIAINMNFMYNTMVRGGTNAQTFLGRMYHGGDTAGNPNSGPGTLETVPHATVHFWTGHDPPIDLNDMGQLGHAARDPVFFGHHGNLDRLFARWLEIGPQVGQNRSYYTDPDFLNANFLFYDENKDLRRVTVAEVLDTTKLGYVYQGANDAAWLNPSPEVCSNLTYPQLAAAAAQLPVPVQDENGFYYVYPDTPFVIVLERAFNPNGFEEFLLINNIRFNKGANIGFDVYINLLDPTSYSYPGKCAEFSGRFGNMASGAVSTEGASFMQDLTVTFYDLQAPPSPPPPAPPAVVVVTLVPFKNCQGLKFGSISITTTK